MNDTKDRVISFSGTRKGMTSVQKDAVREILSKARPQQVRHGDCVGADEEFHQIASMELGIPTVIHPPVKEVLRAFCKPVTHFPGQVDKILEPKEYLERNRELVDNSGILIACPADEKRNDRTGTWYTVRYAINQNRPVILITPEGLIRYSQ